MRLDVQSQCLLFYKAGNLLVNFNRNAINIAIGNIVIVIIHLLPVSEIQLLHRVPYSSGNDCRQTTVERLKHLF